MVHPSVVEAWTTWTTTLIKVDIIYIKKNSNYHIDVDVVTLNTTDGQN